MRIYDSEGTEHRIEMIFPYSMIGKLFEEFNKEPLIESFDEEKKRFKDRLLTVFMKKVRNTWGELADHASVEIKEKPETGELYGLARIITIELR